ncbi:MAG: hypothetical protein WDN03_11365 [Rhizomicrobium sp.]
MLDRHVEADDAAVAPADHVGAGDMEAVEQLDHVVAHLGVGERSGGVGGAALGAAVHRDHGVARRQRGDEIVHGLEETAGAVQHQHGRALAVDLVVEADAVDRGAVAAVELAAQRAPDVEARQAEIAAIDFRESHHRAGEGDHDD